jgi:hypothetical protein
MRLPHELAVGPPYGTRRPTDLGENRGALAGAGAAPAGPRAVREAAPELPHWHLSRALMTRMARRRSGGGACPPVAAAVAKRRLRLGRAIRVAAGGTRASPGGLGLP